MRPPSGHVDEPGIEPEREVLVEPDPEVALALRLLQLAVDAHLGAVVRAGGELDWAAEAELAVRRLPVLDRREGGLQPAAHERPDRVLLRLRQRRVGGERLVERGADAEVRLAPVPARRARPARDEGEA